jgi:hypothetical protein
LYISLFVGAAGTPADLNNKLSGAVALLTTLLADL